MSKKNENMKLIVDASELIKDRTYWLVDKLDNVKKISVCRVSPCIGVTDVERLYFESYIWAMPDNNQAMERWEIYGPIPVIKEPDFEAIKRAGSEGMPIEVTADELANFIRTIDGKHDMGTAILAEHIHNWLAGKEMSLAPALPGMPVSQEPKYGICNNRLFVRATGEFIPADEPVFILRARDKIAISALLNYSSLCARTMCTNHVLAVHARVKDFEKFSRTHPDRMKIPDTSSKAYMDLEAEFT